MKKFLAIFIALFTLFAAGCGKGSLAGSPTDEYARIASLYGDGFYSLSELSYFQARFSTKIYGERVEAANGGPVEISFNYKADISDKNNVKTSSEYKNLLYFDVDGSAVFNIPEKKAFIRNTFYPEGSVYTDFNNFLSRDFLSPDGIVHNKSVLPNIGVFSSVEGEKNGGKYFLFCRVNGDKADGAVGDRTAEFMEWFAELNAIMSWKQSEGLYKVFDVATVKDAKLSLKTAPVGLLDLEAEFKATGFDALGEITVRCSVSYSTAKVDVADSWN